MDGNSSDRCLGLQDRRRRDPGDAALSRDQVAGAIESSLQRGNKSSLDLEKLEADVQRIRAKYLGEGFWDVQVDRRVIYNESLKQARAVFAIREGAPHRVGVVSVEGNQTFEAEEILDWVKIETDEPFDIEQTSADRMEIETRYANEGFYLVQVTADIQPSLSDSIPIVNDLISESAKARVSPWPRSPSRETTSRKTP